MKIKRVSIPIGVIGVIYESRPNVTSDVASLCFKSGNVVILKGGSEAINSNKALAKLFRKALKKNKVNENFIQFIDSKQRKLVDIMPVSYTHLRAHETLMNLVCRLLLEKKKTMKVKLSAQKHSLNLGLKKGFMKSNLRG